MVVADEPSMEAESNSAGPHDESGSEKRSDTAIAGFFLSASPVLTCLWTRTQARLRSSRRQDSQTPEAVTKSAGALQLAQAIQVLAAAEEKIFADRGG